MSTPSTVITTAEIIDLTSANYFEWLLCVLTVYFGACKGSNPKGLYDIVCTDAEWLRENGGDASKARPVRAFPAALADNASAAATAVHNRLSTNHEFSTATIAALKVKLLASIGRTNVLNLSDPVTGTMHLKESAIMIAMDKKYNIIDEITLREAKATLIAPIGVSTHLEDFFANNRSIHNYLIRIKQPMSESDKIEAAITAMTPRVVAGLAIQQYKLLHPNVSDRTFVDFSTYIVTQVPNMVVTTSSLNYANNMSALDIDLLVADAVAKALPGAVAAAMQARSGSLPAITRSRPSKYCYVHGYTHSHNGNECKVMQADKKTYSKVQVNAKDHLAVLGGSTNRA